MERPLDSVAKPLSSVVVWIVVMSGKIRRDTKQWRLERGSVVLPFSCETRIRYILRVCVVRARTLWLMRSRWGTWLWRRRVVVLAVALLAGMAGIVLFYNNPGSTAKQQLPRGLEKKEAQDLHELQPRGAASAQARQLPPPPPAPPLRVVMDTPEMLVRF